MPFDVMVPVKSLDRAKSRLMGLPRGSLMRAFALDTLAACAASAAVRTTYLLAGDDELIEDAARLGCEHLPDLGEGSLNRALARAAETLPGDLGVAALLGDLPYLQPQDLTAALDAVPLEGGVVADADGTGSTMLANLRVQDFDPHFGAGSLRSHLDAGYVPIGLPVPSLRRDVDTARDLVEADRMRLRPGPHTREVLQAHDLRQGR